MLGFPEAKKKQFHSRPCVALLLGAHLAKKISLTIRSKIQKDPPPIPQNHVASWEGSFTRPTHGWREVLVLDQDSALRGPLLLKGVPMARLLQRITQNTEGVRFTTTGRKLERSSPRNLSYS